MRQVLVFLRGTNLIFLFLIPLTLIGQTYDLITPSPTNETVSVWSFLQSVYGKKMLTGVWTESQYGGNDNVVACSGKYPAIWGEDMNSWHSDRQSTNWINTWNTVISQVKTAWGRGQIIQINWHWQGPHLLNDGVYASGPQGEGMGAWSELTTQQWTDILTPGSDLYNIMIEDIDYHINNFLKLLKEDDGTPIPILFRPLHEIDGGWFWWTCEEDPAKTVALWNILYDRIMNYHNMNNLIWIWNNSVLCNGGSWPPYNPSEYPRRLAFYPGDDKCDIVGIDLYGFDPVNRGTYYPDDPRTYRDVWNVMKAITTNKMIAMCEAEALPRASDFFEPDYAPWLYCLSWFSENYYDEFTETTVQLCDWNNTQYNHDNYITAGDVILSSSPNEELNQIEISPNPTNDILVIRKGSIQITSVNLLTITGKVILKQESNFEYIDLSGLSNGIYLVEILNNEKKIIKKVIKK